MKRLKSTVLVLALALIACQSVAPTPMLIGGLREANNQTVALYDACTEGANYVASKEGCDPLALENQATVTMGLAKNLNSPKGMISICPPL